MNSRFLILLIILLLLFVTPASLTRGETYRKWLDCDGTKEPVSDNPQFLEEGIEVYPSPFGKLIFVEKAKVFYHVELGLGWQLDGFVYGARHSNTGKKLLLFKVSGEDIERYFDVRGKREVYSIAEQEGELIVSDIEPEEPGRVIEVLQKWHGADSGIIHSEYLRILSDADWEKMWGRHDKNLKLVPTVDFNKQIVIAILLGNTINTSGVGADAREMDGIIKFRFRAICYQTTNKSDKVTPFGFFVIPRSKKKIIVEEDIQGLKGGPRRWKLRAEFNNLEQKPDALHNR